MPIYISYDIYIVKMNLMIFGESPRIHAGEERFSAPKELPLKSCALALAHEKSPAFDRANDPRPFTILTFPFSATSGARFSYIFELEFC